MKTSKNLILVITLAYLFVTSSCEKLIEIPESRNQIENSVVFADSATANSAVLGAYFTLRTAHERIKYLSLYSDEFAYTATGSTELQFYKSELLPDNISNSAFWNGLYSVIYQANAILEGIDQSSTLTTTTKNQLKADALFLRAFSNFYLLNFWDKVPLISTTDVNLNANARQSSVSQINEQIISGLQQAKTLSTEQYVGAGKVRANKWAAASMLARVYLYLGKWTDAEREASEVLNSGLYTPLPKTTDAFLAGSKESILQLWSVNGFISDASQVVPASTTVLPTYTITEQLYTSFEVADQRRMAWIGINNVTSGGITKPYYYLAKYKNRAANTIRPEYVMVLRSAELYLIRAEANVRQGKTGQAISDLNIIRQRAGLADLPATLSEAQCMNAIAEERKHELFGEWGHRFLDLKRSNNLDAVLGSLKNTWKSQIANAFPIPASEITYNRNLIQNHGY